MLQLALVFVVCTNIAFAAPPSEALYPMLDGRIVGGNDTEITKYPYTVSLLRSGSHYCGGVIISPEWILTAAHCLASDPSVYTIRAGSTYRESGGQIINASYTFTHANYSASLIDYDIGLIRLASNITAENATSIALPVPGAGPEAGATTTITGWGRIYDGGPSPTVLQVVEVPVVSQTDCRAAYGQTLITDRMFCAGVLDVGGKDACQGDSGGPLVIDGVVVGLVSWGAGCALPGFPGVNTNVPALRSWITSISGI